MTVQTSHFGWVSVEKYAADCGMPASELVSQIHDGYLSGARFGDRWYVAPPLASFDPPPPHSDIGTLRLKVFRIGSYLTAGREELTMALHLDDAGPGEAFDLLNDAMQRAVELPVSVTLGGASFVVDSSLWLDLSAALIEFEVVRSGAVDPAVTATYPGEQQ